MADEFEVHIPGYWVKAHFRTLEEAREAARGVIRSPGTAAVDVLTLHEAERPDGRTYWTLGKIEIWAPRLPIDASDKLRVVNGSVVSGKYLIGDKFVCFCISPEERERWRERNPAAPEWLDNPPWDDCRSKK